MLLYRTTWGRRSVVEHDDLRALHVTLDSLVETDIRSSHHITEQRSRTQTQCGFGKGVAKSQHSSRNEDTTTKTVSMAGINL